MRHPKLKSTHRLRKRVETTIEHYKELNNFYARKAWRMLRDWKLNNNPECEECIRKYPHNESKWNEASIVDHIVPLLDDESLALCKNNLQSLCPSCHAWKTARDRVLKERKKKGLKVFNINEQRELDNFEAKGLGDPKETTRNNGEISEWFD